MPYLLDANIFIEAKNRYYGLDFCPAFWDWLVAGNSAGAVYSIEKVGDELAAGTDDLATWAGRRGSQFFLKPDALMLPALGRVSSWASSQNYEQGAVSEFLQEADYYLIAHALAHGHTVVTHERFAATTRQIKIPNVCIPFGVKVVTPFEMLRSERANFVLGPTRSHSAVAP